MNWLITDLLVSGFSGETFRWSFLEKEPMGTSFYWYMSAFLLLMSFRLYIVNFLGALPSNASELPKLRS